MTDMRDARFQKALQEAPDAGARPAQQVAQAIRDAARNALPAPPRPVVIDPWWRRLWDSTARPVAPWNAAFATVLVGVLVTAMWVREPVPDARPFADSAPVADSGPPQPASPSAPAQAPAPAEQKRSVVAKTEPVPAPPPAEQSRVASARISPAPVQVPATATESAVATAGQVAQPAAPMPNQTMAANKATDAVVAEEQSAMARLQKDARSEAKSSRADTAPAAARAVAPAAAPAIASAAAPVSAAVAPALIAQSSTDLSGLDSWTAMRVQMQGRLITLDRAQAQKLFAGMVRLVRQLGQMPAAPRTPSGAPATEPVLRLTVVSQGQTLAVLVLWDATGQWQRPAKDDVTGRVSAADVQALLQLARQSMGADAPD